MNQALRITQTPSLPFTNGQSQRFGRGPSVQQASVQRSGLHPLVFRPLCKRLDATVKAQSSGNTFVVILLLARGPFAVIRRIADIVVLSFDRKSRTGAKAYVGEESDKARPSPTDSNSARAVVGIFRIQRILTTLMHGLPCHVLGLTGHAVFRQSLFLDFFMKAAAGNVRTPHEGRAVYRLLVSAFANAQPIGRFVANEGYSYCSETTRFLSRKILGWHGSSITW